MILRIFLLYFLLKMAQSQLNGEFWWLNEKIAKYNRAIITPPMVEELSEFDNDDNANIIFQDNNTLIDSSEDKTRNQRTTPTESVRFNPLNDDIDVSLVWPVQNKGNNGSNNIVISNYLTKSTSTTPANNIQNLNKNEEFPFLFPDNDSYRPKNTFPRNESTASKLIVGSMSNPVNPVISVNKHTKDRIFNGDDQTRFIFDDRPKFSNINVGDMNNIGKKNQSTSTVKIDMGMAKITNFRNPDSLADSSRPKFSNVNVMNIKSNNFDSKDKIKIDGSDDEVATTFQLQNITNVNNLDFSPFDDTNAKHRVYKNVKKNFTFDQRPKFDDVKVGNIRNDNILWTEKSSQVHNLNIKGNNFDMSNNNEMGIQFMLPKKDNIEWGIAPTPTRSTDFVNKDSNERPISQTVNVDETNKNLVWMNEAKPTQVQSNFQTNYPLSKQNNVRGFMNKKEDSVVFTYPLKDKIAGMDLKTSTTKSTQAFFVRSPSSKVPKYNSLPFTFSNAPVLHSEKKELESQNICKYIEKDECLRRRGFVYTVELQIMLAKKAHDPNLICCILPATDNKYNEDFSKVSFVSKPKTSRLQKRSTSNDKTVQKQRNVLLERLLSQTQNTRLPTHPRIVVPDDDYSDPYWNIKNTKFQVKQDANTHTRYDGTNKDYVEDYADELPKPGLLGIHSNTAQKNRHTSWQFINRRPATTYGVDVVYDSVESDETFGYSTVDPRKVVTSKEKSRRPEKLTTVSNENPLDPESQIISFQADPDFKVFQGFKLLNYPKKKTVNIKNPLTDSDDATESKESEEKIVDSVSESDDYDINEDTQIYGNCGRAVQMSKRERKNKQVGETENGSHPWLGLVVETKQRFNVLCYATIIHPRIAITAAECVFKTQLGEITLIAGLWNLNERARLRSRVVSIYVHPEFTSEDLAYNVAMLHWQHPFRLGVNVQPACLASHDFDNGCMFFGWGGFNEEIHPRSRWQKATIRECKRYLLPNKQSESEDLFCASVQSHDSVIGKGSPLMCNIEGRQAMVGFVVSHEDNLILLSPQKWTKQAVKKLHLV